MRRRRRPTPMSPLAPDVMNALVSGWPTGDDDSFEILDLSEPALCALWRAHREAVETEAQRRGRPASWAARHFDETVWHPQAALQYGWSRMDSTHGVAPWRLSEFLSALDTDRHAVAATVATRPDQRDRLETWLRDMEAFGRRREADADPSGDYYGVLLQLGYHGALDPHDDVDGDEAAPVSRLTT